MILNLDYIKNIIDPLIRKKLILIVSLLILMLILIIFLVTYIHFTSYVIKVFFFSLVTLMCAIPITIITENYIMPLVRSKRFILNLNDKNIDMKNVYVSSFDHIITMNHLPFIELHCKDGDIDKIYYALSYVNLPISNHENYQCLIYDRYIVGVIL